MRFLAPICFLVGTAIATAGETNICAPGAELKKLAGDFVFTEGPACDAHGNVFFTDQPNDRIMRWSTNGELTTFKQPCGRANGLAFDKAGMLWACADEKNELWKISPDGKVTVVLTNYSGQLFNGPNDLWFRPDGGLYFTDPYYQRSYWKRGAREMGEHVYFLPAGQTKPTRVIEDLKQPNGIIGTPDGKILYVADIGARKTYKYRINPDGSLLEKTLFCEMGSDGLTIDSEGNVYLTGKGVSVFDPAGNKIHQIDVPEGWTANVCFGGPGQKTLFITASKSLYAMAMRVHGVNSQ
jgi:gluconolactonase